VFLTPQKKEKKRKEGNGKAVYGAAKHNEVQLLKKDFFFFF
jgi:hypothetical protein